MEGGRRAVCAGHGDVQEGTHPKASRYLNATAYFKIKQFRSAFTIGCCNLQFRGLWTRLQTGKNLHLKDKLPSLTFFEEDGRGESRGRSPGHGPGVVALLWFTGFMGFFFAGFPWGLSYGVIYGIFLRGPFLFRVFLFELHFFTFLFFIWIRRPETNSSPCTS